MNKRVIHIVIGLMAVSLIGIVAVQYFWFRSAWLVKEEMFDRTVDKALENVISKLNRETDVMTLTQNLDLDLPDTSNITFSGQHQKLSKVRLVTWVDSVMTAEYDSANFDFVPPPPPPPQSTRKKFLKGKIEKRQSISVFANDTSKRIMLDQRCVVSDSCTNLRVVVRNPKNYMQNKVMKIYNTFQNILIESETGDLPIEERLNLKSLDTLIRQSLSDKGIDTRVEYGVRDGSNDSLAPGFSKGFSKEKMGIRKMLLPDDLLDKSWFLEVQFPSKNSYLFSSLSLMLMLSLFFTLAIMATFLYTIRIILKQKKISEIKSDFINNMTHEFKTPIATVSLAVDSIDNPKVISDPDRIKSFTKIIREENKRMNVQVESVLRMALLEKGNMEFRLVSADLNALVLKAVENISIQVQSKAGIIDCRFDATEVVSRVDETHFLNIMFNLLDNAIKYSPVAPDITVITKNENSHIVISVYDKGIGIKPEDQKMVFDKFYRVGTGKVHDVKGFGLGLSYVKHMVQAFGGEVRLSSETGNGSCFEIILPTIKE